MVPFHHCFISIIDSFNSCTSIFSRKWRPKFSPFLKRNLKPNQLPQTIPTYLHKINIISFSVTRYISMPEPESHRLNRELKPTRVHRVLKPLRKIVLKKPRVITVLVSHAALHLFLHLLRKRRLHVAEGWNIKVIAPAVVHHPLSMLLHHLIIPRNEITHRIQNRRVRPIHQPTRTQVLNVHLLLMLLLHRVSTWHHETPFVDRWQRFQNVVQMGRWRRRGTVAVLGVFPARNDAVLHRLLCTRVLLVYTTQNPIIQLHHQLNAPIN